MKGRVSEKAVLEEGQSFTRVVSGTLTCRYEGKGFRKSGLKGGVVLHQGGQGTLTCRYKGKRFKVNKKKVVSKEMVFSSGVPLYFSDQRVQLGSLRLNYKGNRLTQWLLFRYVLSKFG